MGSRLTWVVLVLVLVLCGLGAMFIVQNMSRTTQLSFDLYFVAWQLQRPIPVPALIGVCFGSGLLAGVVGMGIRNMRKGRKASSLPAGAMGREPGDDW